MGYPLRTPYPYGPATRFSIVGVQPPATGYLGPSDQISVSVLSPNVESNFFLSLRYLDLNSNVQPLLIAVATPATGITPLVLPIQLAEGFLLSAVAFNGNRQRGQTWVRLVILRQKATDTVVVSDVLLQGYVSQTDYVGWPGTPQLSSLDGRGALLTYAGVGGGVDTAVTLTCPPGTRWHVTGASFDIAGFPASTDASAQLLAQDSSGNNISDGGGIIGVLLPAAAVQSVVFSALTTFIGVGVITPASISADLWLRGGYTLSGILSLSPGGITYSNFQVSVEEFVDV